MDPVDRNLMNRLLKTSEVVAAAVDDRKRFQNGILELAVELLSATQGGFIFDDELVSIGTESVILDPDVLAKAYADREGFILNGEVSTIGAPVIMDGRIRGILY